MRRTHRHAGVSRRRRSRLRGGFSLAELMIALALLGMGLLVIAAALPAGARYTRDSVDLATGAAAAEYALDLIEQSVYLRDTVLDANSLVFTRELRWPPVLFQRRAAQDDPNTGLRAGQADPECEPVIKVRPLFVQNIIRTPSAQYGQELYQWGAAGYRGRVLVEEAIANWLGSQGLPLAEYDALCGQSPGANLPTGPWLQPALPSTALVYPPITADDRFFPEGFWTYAAPNWMYRGRPVNPPGAGSETLRLLERRVTWTAFYRRVEYGPDSDPTLYEFIVIAVRLPTERHRFPVQDPAAAGSSGYSVPTKSVHQQSMYLDVDTLSPIPWLVTFDSTRPLPSTNGGWSTDGQPVFYGSPPATLTFYCTPAYSPLFPVGSVFIPARNDRMSDPDAGMPCNQFYTGNEVRFGPFVRTSWPIYEVVSRPDETTVVVKYNGYFPVQGDIDSPGNWLPPNASQWPVWVIPPACEEVVGSGTGARPVFSGKSPILSVQRRYVRLPNLRPR